MPGIADPHPERAAPGTDDDRFLLCVVGLGNPGPAYAGNRHNIGFRVADRYAERLGAAFAFPRALLGYATATVSGRTLAVCKPLTYMNRSGDAALHLLHHYGWEPQRLLIVYDDVSLLLGTLRLRMQGSSGGHNGLQSIIDALETQHIPRMRLGVGPADPAQELADFVLDDFLPGQNDTVETAIERACDAITHSIVFGMERTMNMFNSQTITSQEHTQ